jgi:hypothetical protein
MEYVRVSVRYSDYPPFSDENPGLKYYTVIQFHRVSCSVPEINVMVSFSSPLNSAIRILLRLILRHTNSAATAVLAVYISYVIYDRIDQSV